MAKFNLYAPLKVIIPLRDVPELGNVTKINGKYSFEVRDEICVRDSTGRVVQRLQAAAGVRYLVREDGQIVAYDSSTEVCWETTADDIHDLVEEAREAAESK